MIGRELVSGNGQPQRFIVDADGEDLLTLAAHPAINQHLETTVLPAVQNTHDAEKEKRSDMVAARRDHLSRWWTFWARRIALRH